MRSINSEKGLPRREYWQELVSQQEQSGLSVHAFCKQRDVTEASFYSWRKQLRNNTGVGFALVDAQGKADKPKAPVALVLATGDRVQIAPGVDAATLRMVIGVLRGTQLIHLPASVRVCLCTSACDMRKSFDGLSHSQASREERHQAREAGRKAKAFRKRVLS